VLVELSYTSETNAAMGWMKEEFKLNERKRQFELTPWRALPVSFSARQQHWKLERTATR